MLRGIILFDGDGEAHPIEWADIDGSILAPEVVEAFRRPRERGGVHVSDLVGCLLRSAKQTLLDYYVPVETAHRMARGMAWDCLAGAFPREGALYQLHLERELGGIMIRGTPDVVTPTSIEDFKSPSYPKKGDLESYKYQLNAYRWLLAPQQEISHLFLRYFYHAGQKLQPVELMPLEEIEEFLRTRLAVFSSFLSQRIVRECEDWCLFCKSRAFFREI